MNALHMIMASVAPRDTIKAQLQRAVPGLTQAPHDSDMEPGFSAYTCDLPIAFMYAPAAVADEHHSGPSRGDVLFMVVDSREVHMTDPHQVLLCQVYQHEFPAFMSAVKNVARVLVRLPGEYKHNDGDRAEAVREAMHSCYHELRQWMDKIGRPAHTALWDLLTHVKTH